MEHNVHKQSSYRQSCRHPPKEQQPTKRRGSRGGTLGHRNINSISSLLLGGPGDSDHELGREWSVRRGKMSPGDDTLDGEGEEDLFTLKTNLLDDLERENSRFRSMSDFYESIPGTVYWTH